MFMFNFMQCLSSWILPIMHPNLPSSSGLILPEPCWYALQGFNCTQFISEDVFFSAYTQNVCINA